MENPLRFRRDRCVARRRADGVANETGGCFSAVQNVAIGLFDGIGERRSYCVPAKLAFLMTLAQRTVSDFT